MQQGPRMYSYGSTNIIWARIYGVNCHESLYPNSSDKGQVSNSGNLDQGWAEIHNRRVAEAYFRNFCRRKKQSNALPGLLFARRRTARAASSGGGILKTLRNPSALNGFLNNTQQVLNSAQQ